MYAHESLVLLGFWESLSEKSTRKVGSKRSGRLNEKIPCLIPLYNYVLKYQSMPFRPSKLSEY